jgi:hypothetical protein
MKDGRRRATARWRRNEAERGRKRAREDALPRVTEGGVLEILVRVQNPFEGTDVGRSAAREQSQAENAKTDSKVYFPSS